ncbi:MAG: protein kinase [Longimicrobiales bacterium]|nr:protein kinase [Longimicrobiales bacterium]
MFDPISDLNAALEGRYRLERPIGDGGMATVYLAEDQRHGRHVAMKVLKPHLTAAVGAERFHEEIRTTANLVHPHILPLFDSGEAAGLLFYTMPFLEGETLRERLRREGRLAVDEAVQIATHVAGALQAAHDRGVVHRDIKPSNLLRNGSNTLVADFGIAQAAARSDATRLTEVGSSIGTAGYMSPEQASGDSEVDHRSDIYSLGCVLFEMLTGSPPFEGQSVVQVLTKQITAPAPSVDRVRPDVPSHVASAVAKALAKEPSERFQSMSDLAAALQRDTGQVSASPRPNAIVVIPFANRSGDPEDEYFSDGLTDEVISDLAGISALRVISRNSAMALKGSAKDTRTLASELGVTHLVTGSVRRAGQALRVTADLVEASTDTPVWSQKFSGTMDDVFGIQEEISRQIVAALEVRLTDNEKREVTERRIDDPVAFDCYLRARQVMYHWTPLAQQQALQLVDQAMAVVGETPLLLATKGQIHWNMVQTGLGPEQEGLESASAFATKALEMDPEHDLAIYLRGLVAGTRGRPETALPDLHRARQLRPNDGNVLVELTRFSQSAGIQGRSTFLAELLRVDPLAPQAQLLAAMGAYYDGPAEAAAAPARRALELAPDPSMLHCVAGLMLAHAGSTEEAGEVLDRVVASRAADPHRHVAAFFGHAIRGERERAAEVPIAPLIPLLCNEHLLRMLADGYALLGRQEDALEVLRYALRYGFVNHPDLAFQSATLDALRGTAAFQELLAQIEPRWRAVCAWERTAL